jgi:hypothetical protein
MHAPQQGESSLSAGQIRLHEAHEVLISDFTTIALIQALNRGFTANDM